MSKITTLYRHEIVYPTLDEDDVFSEENNSKLKQLDYRVIKETKCGYWIIIPCSNKRKWVSKTARKRFAYPTVKESLNYFIHRKLSYIGHMNFRVRINRHAVKLAKDLYLNE